MMNQSVFTRRWGLLAALLLLAMLLAAGPSAGAAEKSAIPALPALSAEAQKTLEDAGIAPRRPEVPAAAEGVSDHPIDRFIAAYFAEHGRPLPAAVDDHRFARRVYLDTIGMLPSDAELAALAADADPKKRERLVERLLDDRHAYAQHWLSFWNDVLRNDYQGTGYIDGGRKQITAWLYAALVDNMPYDQFVQKLISPESDSEGFVRGIVWRGVVNASQRAEVQAAQNVAQVFMGINLKCASCHDSFINEWKLSDAYGLAGIFADDALEMHHCDRPTGEFAELKFIYPELGEVDAKAPRKDRLAQLAAIVTRPENGRLSRTIINRLWARFFGRGLVEPTDDMEQPAWNAELLDWLAADLVDHGYDLKHTIRLLLSSAAYQMPAVDGGELADDEFVFAGPLVRRMSAEQYCDAISQLTGVWQINASGSVLAFAAPTADGADRPIAELASEAAATKPSTANDDASASHHGHEFTRFASGVISKGAAEVDIDVTGARTLWLVVSNGREGGHSDWAVWADPRIVTAEGEVQLVKLDWKTATAGYGKTQKNKNVDDKPLRLDGQAVDGLGTHAESVIVYDLPEGTTRFRVRCGPDSAVVERDDNGHEMEFFVMTDIHWRAALAPADPLMRAMGRPNREQVMTVRPSIATTLEALELTNGETLDATLRRGAADWLKQNPESATALVESVYQRALGRSPSEAERTEAAALVGSPPTEAGVEDLLWVVVMLPEFQLIY